MSFGSTLMESVKKAGLLLLGLLHQKHKSGQWWALSCYIRKEAPNSPDSVV